MLITLTHNPNPNGKTRQKREKYYIRFECSIDIFSKLFELLDCLQTRSISFNRPDQPDKTTNPTK